MSVSYAPALRNGLAVLMLLAVRKQPMSAARIMAELDLPRSTTYHLLSELQLVGLVDHLQKKRQYVLGPSAELLGDAYRQNNITTDDQTDRQTPD
ncbi:helix-turn-helix domain-containing protein [Lentzea sp. NBRC 102530]|uniref:helix-turn-helix domain-containing protein n=1 Tax=Lentzea sp. NBRC 102530 TaxID=3032201 RepID=UPI0024A39FA1|nr:helix-turn-helix domain-containing protein [Lentzea sp. NBRC 102530]GLY54804.1 hypothetical protein Lesp01_84590 [Lentzea sp. NBRC 102530]